ncbi:MAG: ATP-binding protein [Candidatus Eremiobacteraeota bacterium]|nr:ATP-binding protein [Candidatus Eremiobacteraeota bacterium]
MADVRTYRGRYLENPIRQALRDTRVVALVGPRQAGKSTLARHLDSASYRTFDDFGSLAAASADPLAFVTALPVGAIIDEVQRLPAILRAIKSVVDTDPTPGRFILTGSANLLTIPTLSESLAGRIELFTLYPFSQAEIDKSRNNFVDMLFTNATFRPVTETAEQIIGRITTGGYPEVLQRENDSRRNAWFQSYLTTILQRDVRELSAISDVLGMERLLRLCAARSASILNETALASEIGLPRKTVSRYLGLLEQIFLLSRLPAYARERGRRVTRAPKVHLNDVGLAAYLHGSDFESLLQNRSMLGGLLETLVVNEIRSQASWSSVRPALYHYREYDGLDIDLVLEKRDSTVAAIEVKATASPGKNDFRSLRRFAELAGDSFQRGVLLYGGSSPLAFGEKLVALPIATLWS